MERHTFLIAAAGILFFTLFANGPALAQYVYPYDQYPMGRNGYPEDPYLSPYDGYVAPYGGYDGYEAFPEYYYPEVYGGYWEHPQEEHFAAGQHPGHAEPGHGGTGYKSGEQGGGGPAVHPAPDGHDGPAGHPGQ